MSALMTGEYCVVVNEDSELKEKITSLKKRRNAIILAHNYQLGEVQNIADFVGDSLELSQKAAETDADVAALQDELTRRLGLPVEIKCRKNGSGELCIHYTRPIELDGVLRKLRA